MELLFETRASGGLVKDFYSQTGNNSKSLEYKTPPYVYDVLMDMVEADPILFNAISLTVDLATYNGYCFKGESKEAIEQAYELFNDELDFDRVIDNSLWQLLVYGDAYIEIVWNESKTKVMELHPLESSEMVIDYTAHGEIVNFKQKLKGKSPADYPNFSPEDIIYFRHYWVGTQVYSKSPFKAMSKSFATKMYANDYLQSIFRNLPPKIVYFLKSANKEQRRLFIEDLIAAKTDANRDIVATGEAFESKMMEVQFSAGLMSILEYLRKEILMVTRVPPHWVGILDGANRGIGENVVIPYETKIKKLQQTISSQINRELMSKLNLSELEFSWNAISLVDEKEIIANMGQLSAQHFDSKTIIQYARDHGLKLHPDAEIVVQMAPTAPGTQIQDDSAPSRQRAGKNEKLANNLNSKGTSEEGKIKLESKKVM